MSFWGVWKRRTIWLLKTAWTPWPIAWAWLWAKMQRWPTAAVLAFVVVLAIVFWNRTAIWDVVTQVDDGKIIVNTPTVYTRQRLVNDRLDQARWLRTQLEATENGKDKNFKIVDQVQVVSSSFSAGAGGVNADKAEPIAGAGSVDATTTAIFRAKNAYREEVRSEITQTELDDRHDIDGNTIFRLTFDASVVAGTKRDSIAVVVVSMNHDTTSADGKAIYATDYRALYQDWLRYFQSQLRKSLSSVPYSLLTNDPYPPVRLLFTNFVIDRICHLVTQPVDKLLDEIVPCTADSRPKAEEMLRLFTTMRAERLGAYRKASFEAQLQSYASGNRRMSLSTRDMLDIAQRDCALDPNRTRVPAANLFIQEPNGMPAAGELGCPYIDSLKERLHAGIMLYENLLRLRSGGRFAASQYEAARNAAIAMLDCESGGCEIPPWMLKCYTADFLKSSLNGYGQHAPQPQQKIDHFLKLDIVGRNIADCDLLVSGRIGRYSAASGSDESEDKRLNEFIDYLNRAADGFAYSVTPKNLTENISTAAETRDAYAAILRGPADGKEIANFLKQRSEQNQAIIAHPIIVGFGAAAKGPPQETRRLTLDFGWIVAPRSRSARHYEQIDGQYPLTVFISVPAWWRSMHADIRTCWLSRSTLAKLPRGQTAANLCRGDEMVGRQMMIRLPTAIPEVSRKLAFDVLQEPSLYDNSMKELTIGARGLLLLEGARLWRSTEVTAGAQHADKITVLPNMEGILAEFDCVRPPDTLLRIAFPKPSGQDEKTWVTRDWIRVWTSEGVTDKMPLTFVWPNELLEYRNADKACPSKLAAPPPTPPAQPTSLGVPGPG